MSEILSNYPTKGIWTGVKALTNRSITQKESLWPDDPRLDIISGLDLLQGSQEELEATLRSKVKDIGLTTHVYYLGE